MSSHTYNKWAIAYSCEHEMKETNLFWYNQILIGERINYDFNIIRLTFDILFCATYNILL